MDCCPAKEKKEVDLNSLAWKNLQDVLLEESKSHIQIYKYLFLNNCPVSVTRYSYICKSTEKVCKRHIKVIIVVTSWR